MSSLNLLDLPKVVIDKVLDNLDLRTLKKLRLVSKETRDWVEQPPYLQKFKICIRLTDEQKVLSTSSVPWNNFKFYYLLDEIIPEFASKFGPIIKHLELTTIYQIPEENFLNQIGPVMETLVIEKAEEFNSREDWMVNFGGLKSLRIDNIEHSRGGIDSLFGLILKECWNLQDLWIPQSVRLTTERNSTEEVGSNPAVPHSECFYINNLIIQPILEYLNRIEKKSIATNLKINFGPYWKTFTQLLIRPEDLNKLVPICSRVGVKLMNVPFSAMPNYTSKLTLEKRKMCEKVVTSVYACTLRLDFVNIFIPTTTKVKFRLPHSTQSDICISGPIDRIAVTSHYKFAHLPPLIYQNIFQTVRPTVKKLDYYLPHRAFPEGTLFGRDIATSFPNLTSLNLNYIKGIRTKDFYVIFRTLELLEKLKLSRCGLCDQVFIGPSPSHLPPIFNLKNLWRLDLGSCDTPDNMTDKCFTNAFRYMKLKSFNFWSSSNKITFHNGISTLASIEGGFRDSIQHLELRQPDDCLNDEIDTFVDKFKKLQVFKLDSNRPFSQSVILNKEVYTVIHFN